MLRQMRDLGQSIALLDQNPSLLSVPAVGNIAASGVRRTTALRPRRVVWRVFIGMPSHSSRGAWMNRRRRGQAGRAAKCGVRSESRGGEPARRGVEGVIICVPQCFRESC